MHEYYATPMSASVPVVRELYPEVKSHSRPRVFDPGCGEGALGYAVRKVIPTAIISGVEIDEVIVGEAIQTYNGMVEVDDFLTMHGAGPFPHLIICNPPFSLWTEFVDRIFDKWAGFGTKVAVLGRLGILAAQKRHNWWTAVPTWAGRGHGLKLRVLSQRPSFTEDGRTDSYDYCWFVWNLPKSAPALAWYRG